MDSGSDSDDDLFLTGPTFANRRQQNRAARAREQQSSLLSMALQDCDRMVESSRRLSLAKQQNGNDDGNDGLLALSEQNQKGASTTKKMARGTPASQGGYVDLEGSDEQDGALDIKRRRQLAEAYATEGSSCLGTRMIISFDMNQEKCQNVEAKSTCPEEAIERLEQILSNFEKENTVSPDIDNVVKSIRTAVDLSVLPDLLMEKRLVRKLFKSTTDEANIAPFLSQLTWWLYRTATSAGLMTTSKLPQGALQTLLELAKKRKLPQEMLQSPISQLFSDLLLWIDSKDVLQDDMVKNDDTKKPACDNQEMDTEADAPVPMDIENLPTKRNNETGLINLLLFWEQLIPIWSPSPFELEAATNVVVVLCRLALDPMANSNAYEMYLFPLLQRVVSAMLDLVASHFDKSSNGDEKQGNAALQEWMDKTVQAVFGKDLNQVGRRLGLNGENSPDEDDDNASLCYASTVRLIPIHLQHGETHKLSVELKARLAVRALEILCGSTGNSKEENRNTTTCEGFSSSEAAHLAKRELPALAWTAFSAVVSTLSHLISLGHDLTKQGPRSLATLECISMCFETVLILLNGAAAGLDKDEYTPAQANVVVEMLATLDQQTKKLGKHIFGSVSNSNARRMDHHLTCFRQYYERMRERAARLTGDVEKVKRQSKITSFAASSP